MKDGARLTRAADRLTPRERAIANAIANAIVKNIRNEGVLVASDDDEDTPRPHSKRWQQEHLGVSGDDDA